MAPERWPSAEDHHSAGTHHRPLLRFGIQTRPRPFLPEEEISKTRELYVLASSQGVPDGAKEGLHQPLAFALGKTQDAAQMFGDILFRGGHTDFGSGVLRQRRAVEFPATGGQRLDAVAVSA